MATRRIPLVVVMTVTSGVSFPGLRTWIRGRLTAGALITHFLRLQGADIQRKRFSPRSPYPPPSAILNLTLTVGIFIFNRVAKLVEVGTKVTF